MFSALIRAALRSRAAVLIATLLVLIWGVFAFRELTIEAFPDPTDTQVNIISIYPGQPAAGAGGGRAFGLDSDRACRKRYLRAGQGA